MNDVVDACGMHHAFVEARSARAVPATPGRTRVAGPGEPWRDRRERWHSTLCDDDLACLLMVLEGELIPMLVKGYSPARHAPLVTSHDAK